jgi:hypothetical protein
LEALCIYHGIDPSHVDEVAKGLTLFFNEWKRYKKDQWINLSVNYNSVSLKK